jgi:hypothetical protein
MGILIQDARADPDAVPCRIIKPKVAAPCSPSTTARTAFIPLHLR